MAKPTIVPLWDTNLTNSAAPTGLQISDGHVNAAVPTSQVTNYWQSYVGAWCAFLNTLSGTRTLSLPIQGPSTGLTSVDVSLAGVFLTVMIPLEVSKRILAVRAVIKDSATGPTKLLVSLASATATGTAFSPIAFSAASAGTGVTQTIAATGLTTVIAAGNVYVAQVTFSTGTQTCHVYGIEVDYDQP